MKKIILITGASSGFGYNAVKELLKQGHVVYAVARRLEKMNELKDLGAKIYKVDVTIEEDIKFIVKTIIEKESRIDVLVNNAGYGSYGVIEGYPIEDAKKQFDTNLFALARLTQEVLPYMRDNKKGTIINMSSVVGKVAFPMLGWYSASKHALEGYSDALRREVKSLGIKVVLIQPGAIKTEFLDVAKSISNTPEEYEENTNNFITCFEKRYQKAKGPKKVVATIVKAVNKKNPKVRYKLGFDSKLAINTSKVLPNKLTDKIIRSTFKIK